eukprot:IDg20493t1
MWTGAMALFLHHAAFCILALTCVMVLRTSAQAVQVNSSVECRHDEAITHVTGGFGFIHRSALSGLRLKDGPATKRRGKRSIARCSGIVESITMDETLKSYLDIPIGGV